MKQAGESGVLAFIRNLHARAGEERFTIKQFNDFITKLIPGDEGSHRVKDQIIGLLNDPQDGIKAVTKEGKGGK